MPILNVLLLCHFGLLILRRFFSRLRKAPALTGLVLVILWLSEHRGPHFSASVLLGEILRFSGGACLGYLLLLITARISGLEYPLTLGNVYDVLAHHPPNLLLVTSALAEEIVWRGIIMYKAIEILNRYPVVSYNPSLLVLGIVLANLFFVATHNLHGKTMKQVIELFSYFCLLSFAVYFSKSLTIGVAMHLSRNLAIVVAQHNFSDLTG